MEVYSIILVTFYKFEFFFKIKSFAKTLLKKKKEEKKREQKLCVR